MKFELVTPERLMASTKATHVKAPGEEGSFGVLPGHMPFVSTLKEGNVEVTTSLGEKQTYKVRGGFAEVTADSVTVLAEYAEVVA